MFFTDADNIVSDTEAEKKLVRKLDTRLLPFLSFMYLFSSLDRSSLGKSCHYLDIFFIYLLSLKGNAVLDNFEEDVGITPDQFNTCVTIFYVITHIYIHNKAYS